MKEVTIIGIDLAKRSFQVHGATVVARPHRGAGELAALRGRHSLAGDGLALQAHSLRIAEDRGETGMAEAGLAGIRPLLFGALCSL